VTKIGPTPAQYVTLKGGGTSVRVLRGQTPPSVTGGYGGWTQVARPRRKALTQWDGGTPYELTFSVFFDGIFDRSGSVEGDIAKLEKLARSPAAGTSPPIITIDGAVPHSDRQWVVEDLQWDPNPIYSYKGNRVRHECTVVLLEHVGSGVASAQQRALASVNPAGSSGDSGVDPGGAAPASPNGGGSGTYLVRAGDTLDSIAAFQLGDASLWTGLAALNGIRDPRTLATGQKLRLQ
jgi:hypothetical protein